MPKKKTGQRKKAEKQKLRQKEIRSKETPFADYPCNAAMECDKCQRYIKKKLFIVKPSILVILFKIISGYN